MITLRQATDSDYDFLYALHMASMKDSITATWGWDEAWQADYFRQHFDPLKRQIVTLASKAIGVISVEQREDEQYLALIEILPEYQGQGIGSALIGDFIQAAHAQGMAATLHVLKRNEPAYRLYKRLGFQLAAEEEVKYKLICAPRQT